MQTSRMQTYGTRDRRSYPRKELYKQVLATNTIGKVSSLLGINYSKTGIAIITYKPIDIGDVLNLEFSIRDHTGSSPHMLKAEVIQSFNVADIFVWGLQFKEELEQY